MPCKHCHKPKIKKVKRVEFIRGRFYKGYDNNIYICARVNSHEDYRKGWWALINMADGNRFRDPVDSIKNVGDIRFKEVTCAISTI